MRCWSECLVWAVGPFGGKGAVESFDFAVGLRPVGTGPDMTDADRCEGVGP